MAFYNRAGERGWKGTQAGKGSRISKNFDIMQRCACASTPLFSAALKIGQMKKRVREM